MTMTVPLGAGASKPAGIPLAVELGNMLGTGAPEANPPIRSGSRWSDYTTAIADLREFLTTWWGSVDPLHKVDVEDIVDLAELVQQSTASSRNGTPQLWTLPDELEEFAAKHHSVLGRIGTCARKEVVQFTTLEPDADLSYLLPLLDDSCPTIVTLNYDLTVETMAEQELASLNAHFEVACHDSHDWGRNRRLLKVHGSNNWSFAAGGGGNSGGRYEDWQYANTEDPTMWTDVTWGLDDVIPGLILGGTNKLTARGPYLELMAQFRHAVKAHTTRLIVVGYSFRDRHVNDVIAEYSKGYRPNGPLIVVDKDLSVVKPRLTRDVWLQSEQPNIRWIEDDAKSGIQTAFDLDVTAPW